jgi:hypothetical protein
MAEKDEVIKDPEAAADAARINEQCFLIENMDLLAGPRNKQTTPGGETEPKDALILADSSMKAADVVSLLNRGELAEQFLLARPAQLGYLVPQLRLYVPSEDASKKDSIIYFSEYYAPPGTIKKYDGTSDDPEGVIFKENGKGRGVGISQFSFALDNKHPGAISFMANLELKFSSIRDLAEGPYISLLSPMGFSKDKKPNAVGGKSSSRQELIAEQLKQLRDKKEDLKMRARAHGRALNQKKNVKGILTPRSNRLKAVVGWAIPSFADESVIPMTDKKFYQTVKSNQMVLLLSMTNYKLTFGESGEATLSIDYAASIEESFSGPQSNVFPDSTAIGRLAKIKTKKLKGIESPTKAKMHKQYGKGTELGRILSDNIEDKMDTGAWAATKATVVGGWADSTTKTLLPSLPVREGLVRIDLRILQKELEELEVKDSPSPGKIKEKKVQVDNTKHALVLIGKEQRKGKYEYYLTKLTGNSQHASKVRIINVPENLLGRGTEPGTAQAPGSVTNRRQSGKKPLKYSNLSNAESATSGIQTVINAESGTKREEAHTKVRTDKKLNPLATKPTDGTLPVRFILFGDLINAMIEVLRSAGVSEAQKIILGTVAIPSSKLLRGGPKYINIADIPVSLNAFQVFFLDRVVKPQKSAYPMRLFMQDLLRYILEPAFNQCGGSPEDGGVSFESTILSTSVDIKDGTVIKETDPVFKQLSNRDWNSLVNSPDANEYMIIYSQEKKEGNGDFNEDKKKGVYHLVLGAERGLVKSFSFSQQTNQYLQTQNIVNAANGGSELGVLALPQDASITMMGNNLFRTGQTVYINAEFAMGREVARELMMGGYYVITKVSNSLSASGFETSLDCRWTNFPQAKPAGK